MARFKSYSYKDIRQITASIEDIIEIDPIAFTIHYVVEEKIDRSVLEARYRNDRVGAPAYDPAILLKLILYGYACGLISSRKIAKACRENIVFGALGAGAQPHFTTLAAFVSSLPEVISSLFVDVLKACERRGLVGEETLALDGCRLPSNASKEWSGTKAELTHKQEKQEARIAALVAAHQRQDRSHEPADLYEREEKQLKTLRAARDKLAQWLATHDDKIGAQGKPIKSNVTDNDSAKMKSSHGIIQGYDGIAMVDQKHQVIVHAEAFGAAQEQSLLIPMLEGTRERFQALGEPGDIFHRVRFVADTGFYTEAGLRYLFEHGIDAYLPDPHFRQRDPRFQDAKQHTPQRERSAKAKRSGRKFRPKDFVYDAEKGTCTCPAGHPMYLKNSRFTTSDGYQAVSFQARLSDCRVCPLRKRCLQREDQVSSRQVYFFHGRSAEAEETFTDKMKRKIDTWSGRMLYGLRVAVVEPVFGNLENNIGLHRFTLRGKPKVNAQWLLYCMVHTIGKLCRYGYGFT